MNTNILVLVVLALFSQVATIYGQRPTRKDVHLNIPIEIHLNNKAYLMHNRLMPRFQRLDLFYYMTAYHHSIIKSVNLRFEEVFRNTNVNVTFWIRKVRWSEIRSQDRWVETDNEQDSLNSFCSVITDPYDPNRDNTFYLLVKSPDDIVRSIQSDDLMTGFSNSDRVCRRDACGFIVDPINSESPLVFAHELGYLIGLNDEEVSNCLGYYSYLDEEMFGNVQHNCNLDQFLRKVSYDRSRFDCLKNVPARRYTNFEMNYDRFFLGSVFKDEGACRIYRPGEEDYGTNRCPHQIYKNRCLVRCCVNPGQFINGHLLDGTKCSPNKICLNNKCVPPPRDYVQISKSTDFAENFQEWIGNRVSCKPKTTTPAPTTRYSSSRRRRTRSTTTRGYYN